MRIAFVFVVCIEATPGLTQVGDSTQQQTYEWVPDCKVPPEWWQGQRMLQASTSKPVTTNREKWLDASGDISYQYFYREGQSDQLSQLNTQNHLGLVRLSLVYRERYPFQLAVRYNRMTPFQADNLYEVNVGFDKQAYRRLLLARYERMAKEKFDDEYTRLRALYEDRFRDWQRVEQARKGAAGIQRRAEEELRVWKKKQEAAIPSLPAVPGIEGINKWNDSLRQLIPDWAMRPELFSSDSLLGKQWTEIQSTLLKPRDQWTALEDSLLQIYRDSEADLRGLRQKYQHQLDSVQESLSKAVNTRELENAVRDSTDSLRTKQEWWRSALMRTHLRAGKFLVNLSELTVNNLFLHGGSVRYGDRHYVELLAGVYDFAFRQIFGFRNDTAAGSRPHVWALRLGRQTETDAQAFTFFAGRKRVNNSTDNNFRQIAGFSYEWQREFGRNWRFTAELAKSTARPLSTSASKEEGLRELLTSFRKETLAGFGQVQGSIPQTQTEVELGFRYWGQQFESFNSTQLFNPQNQWRAQLRQPVWKRRLVLTGGLRYSDFRTAGISSNLRSRTLFTSANAVIRIPRLPVVSIGYYPGSQLYWMSGDKLYEYFYSILQATVSHHFQLAAVPMQATVSFNRFTNEYRDSLVSPHQDMINVFWSAWKNAFSFSINGSRQRTVDQDLLTLEGGMSWAGKRFRLGSSLKWNQLGGSVRWAGSANVGLSLGSWGTINLLYDRSFFPDRTGQFLPISMGQVQYIKPLNFSVWR